MAGNPKPKAKKPSSAELKRRKLAASKKPVPKKKKSPLDKKKMSNKEATELMRKEIRARKHKADTKKHMKKNKGGQGGNKSA